MSQDNNLLASKINFLNLYCVDKINNKLLQLILTVLLVTATSSVLCHEPSKIYVTSFNQNKSLAKVFKLTDSKGNITYSSAIPDELIQIEKIVIATPPSDAYIENTRKRHEKLKIAAVELAEARERREAKREEKENKRLQRLALLNNARPPIIYQRHVYPGHPYRLRKKHSHGGYYQTNKPVHLPANVHRSSSLALPPSSFSPMFSR